MTDIQRIELLARAKAFFAGNIIPSHHVALDRASKLKEYKINPFVINYLAKFLCGDCSPESLAKALIYPRILGTSMTTIFGNQAQRMIATLFEGMGSTTSGIDIEYIDSFDGRRKYCQVKAGPNTINSDDVKTVQDHFNGVRRLARTNHLTVDINDMVVGVLYGTTDDLSAHYRRISTTYPVIVGADFWHRLTGDADFYNDLIFAFRQAAEEVDSREVLEAAILQLANEISESDIF